ncbi:putative oxidoreductase YcjS [Polystyrenella longa]|uniref:Putative oxidoreductase YcjS n=1 Tax=Polystyrenella longa TaxID=2528007 RepID=A0A518CN27_9PLAN|nr:Gfo/Idh/MocA family oxidoreductase [Polystyrenella longa]QDU80604.1 putative oxidoreductase YcjS [Polystyrenella longa]
MQKTWRVAVIGRSGKGNYGHGLDVVWKDVPGVEVVAVADDNKSSLADALERTGAKRSYLNYKQMLAKEKPDIVSISQRWIDQHHEMAMEAAEQECHIYMEKPFTPTLREADEVIAALESKHLKLAIAHTTRYSPVIAKIREMVTAGEIGTLVEMRGRGKEDGRGGGEDLWVLGSHVLDMMRYFNGDVEACSARVFNEGHPITKEDVVAGNEGIGPLAGDTLFATYEFQNGIPGYFNSTRNPAGSPGRFGLTLFGSKGAIRMTTGYTMEAAILRNGTWSPHFSKAQWEPIKAEEKGHSGHGGGNHLAVLDLIRAINEDSQPICNMYDARAATEMIAAVFESHRQETRVEFPLENRENPLTMLS